MTVGQPCVSNQFDHTGVGGGWYWKQRMHDPIDGYQRAQPSHQQFAVQHQSWKVTMARVGILVRFGLILLALRLRCE